MCPAVFDCNAELDEMLRRPSIDKRPKTYQNLTRLRPKPLPIQIPDNESKPSQFSKSNLYNYVAV